MGRREDRGDVKKGQVRKVRKILRKIKQKEVGSVQGLAHEKDGG